jgi:DNA-directed RNA polymerase specialized sigma24 family protein
VAARHLGRERPGHTLQPTALVNEAYLRLVGQRDVQWQNREHFIGVAAQLMRLILVDHHRKKRNAKRGGGDFLALDTALTKLAEQDERKAKIAELKYFGGLNTEETAEALSISTATVVREWRLARAWLQRELTC